MAVLDVDRKVWDAALDAALPDVPDVLILEGTWWRADATRSRLSRLREVTELPFPDMHVGRHGDAVVAYCCAYGAARAVEPAHVFTQCGTPLVIQIGTCGVLVPGIAPGDVAVPLAAVARDGVSHHYGAGPEVSFDAGWRARAAEILRDGGAQVHETRHLTWPSLFAQSDAMCAGWAAEGLQTVDMEAAAVAAVAARFGAACITLLATWDQLDEGRTFLDPLSEEAADALRRANVATYETGLRLATEVAGRRQNRASMGTCPGDGRDKGRIQ